ncbi:MAG: hypothetical protein C7B44_08805 [Sulfobacillus thermosulfidooxidans]|nr:MAG: hypothetical protein C7B44_08805 [Sulfobacillus thermosulfidooxidans]
MWSVRWRRRKSPGPPIHDPFQSLNFVVKSFHHPLASKATNAGEYGRLIVTDAFGKADEFRNATQPEELQETQRQLTLQVGRKPSFYVT